MSHRLRDRRARHDAVHQKAKDASYAGRAVYKLVELDERFRLLGRGKRVLDLGCWPGSWMQYALERVGEDGRVVGIDLRPVTLALPQHATAFVGDVELLTAADILALGPAFDVVVSDMAPHTTGDRHSDLWRSEELYLCAVQIAQRALRPGGHFAAKVFQGGRFPELLRTTRAAFAEVRAFRTKATRQESFEQYIVGRGLKRRIEP